MRILFFVALATSSNCILLADDAADALQRYTALMAEWKYEEAVPFAEEYLKLTYKSFGPDHPKTAEAISNLGVLHYGLREYDKAEPLYASSLLRFEASLGKDHPALLGVLGNLGELYRKIGKYDEAEKSLKRAKEMSVALYGEDDLSTQHISETLQALSIHRLETWTDSTGRFHHEARFLGLTAGKVILRLKDGEIMEIPLNKLSEDSQATAVACSILRKRYDEKSSAQVQ